MSHALIPTARSRGLAALAAVAMLVASTGESRADKHINSTGAAILGGMAGLVIGAAIADSNHRHRTEYYPPRYQPYPAAQPYPAYYPAYRPRYAAPFSPAPGVTCDPNRGLCFNDNGSRAKRWTARVFGY